MYVIYNNPRKPSGRNELFQKAFVVLTVTLASSLRYPLFTKTSAGCQNMLKETFLRTLPRHVASICKIEFLPEKILRQKLLNCKSDDQMWEFHKEVVNYNEKNRIRIEDLGQGFKTFYLFTQSQRQWASSFRTLCNLGKMSLKPLLHNFCMFCSE